MEESNVGAARPTPRQQRRRRHETKRPTCGPNSLAITWMIPPAPVPSAFLSSIPANSSPRSMMTRVSPGDSSSVSSSGWP